MHSPTLEGRGLAKRYGAITAVRDINFSISAGQILGVLGPNGAGKSTIVKMITGMVEPAADWTTTVICDCPATSQGTAAPLCMADA